MGKLSNVLKLAPAPAAARSPERQKLADKLAAYHDIQAQIAALERVTSESLGIWAMEAEIEERKEAIKVAADGEVQTLIEGATGAESPKRQTVSEARAALEQLETKLANACEARERALARIASLRQELTWAAQRVEMAFRDAVQTEPTITQLWTEFLKAREHYYLLRYMMDGGWDLRGPTGLFVNCGPKDQCSRDVIINHYRPHGADLLHAGLQRLMTNADEQLPTFDDLVYAQSAPKPAA